MRDRISTLATKLGGLLAGVIAVLLIGCAPEAASSKASSAADEGAWNLQKKRDWAARLRADGLDELAAEAYESILREEANLSPALVAGLSINIAEIHHASSRYEDALASLYRARLFDLKGERKRRVETLAIECLERLGRGAAADRLLDRTTALDGEATSAEAEAAVVVAEIGDDQITRAEFETLLASTNLAGDAAVRDDAARRREVLESLVAQRVLVRKARKLGYAEDPKVRLAVDLATQQVLVRKLMSEELRDELELAPEDVQLYFEAKREFFRTPSRVEIEQIVVDDAETESELREKLSAGESFAALAAKYSRHEASSSRGGRIEEPLIEGRSHPDFARVDAVFSAIADTPPGEVASASHRSAQGRHLIRVIKREDGRLLPFEEVKEEVARLARAEREQAAVQRLMRAAIESADVKIHAERLK
jgi:peptidyl-prolyl cis-trans isomerase C